MSTTTAMETFASGRYSKRKRTQVTYHMDELDVSDSESGFGEPQTKKCKASATCKPRAKSKIFPFMQLPAEIRIAIYSYALTEPGGIHFLAAFKHRRRITERVSREMRHGIAGLVPRRIPNKELRAEHEKPATLNPSLLATSKQIYLESRDILYGNDFSFMDTQALYSFLINVGPRAAKRLKSVRLLKWGGGRTTRAYNHACFAVLAGATNLEHFYLDATLRFYGGSPRSMAENLYRDAFPWFEEVGIARGKVDAAVDILKHEPEGFSYRNWGNNQIVSYSAKEILEQFQDAMRKLLGAQQKRVMGKPVARRRKVSKEV